MSATDDQGSGDANRDPGRAERLQRGRLGPPMRRVASWARTPAWILTGGPAPAPPHVKSALVARYPDGLGLTVSVETGTFHGDTVAPVRPSLLNGSDGYPTLDAVLDLVRAHRPASSIAVVDDIVRILP
ncbi:MAG: hypothetical protein QM733_14390 [Ilumatobacteraceae bacterium]